MINYQDLFENLEFEIDEMVIQPKRDVKFDIHYIYFILG